MAYDGIFCHRNLRAGQLGKPSANLIKKNIFETRIYPTFQRQDFTRINFFCSFAKLFISLNFLLKIFFPTYLWFFRSKTFLLLEGNIMMLARICFPFLGHELRFFGVERTNEHFKF